MAGTTQADLSHLQKQVSQSVITKLAVKMAPLQEIHTWEQVEANNDAKGIRFYVDPSGTRLFTAITDGVLYQTYRNSPSTYVDVDPTVYIDADLPLKNTVRSDPRWMDRLTRNFVRGSYQTSMTTLTNLYDNLTSIDTVSGSGLTAAAFHDAVESLAGSGWTEDELVAHLDTKAFAQLREDAGTAFIAAPLGAETVRTGLLGELYGVRIFRGTGIGNDGTDYENFIGTRDCIGMAIAIEPSLLVKEQNAAQYEISYSFTFAAAVLDAAQGRWLKSGIA